MTKLTLKNLLSPETQAKLMQINNQAGSQDKPASKAQVAKSKAQNTKPVEHSSQSIDAKTTYQNNLHKIKMVQDWLSQMWPNLFDMAHPKPLKRQIERDIFPHIAEPFTKKQVRNALEAYVSRSAYLEAMLTNDWRFDLLGNPVEEITDVQRQYSRQKLDLKKQQPEASLLRRKKLSTKAGGEPEGNKIDEQAVDLIT